MRYIFILKDFMGQCLTCLIHQSYHCGDKVIEVHGYDLVEQNISFHVFLMENEIVYI